MGDGHDSQQCIGRERLQAVVAEALSIFIAQLLLNALWTPLFFGMHRPDLALADIVLMWLAIATTLGLFWRVQRGAGLLPVPYLGWISFATALNFAIWSANQAHNGYLILKLHVGFGSCSAGDLKITGNKIC